MYIKTFIIFWLIAGILTFAYSYLFDEGDKELEKKSGFSEKQITMIVFLYCIIVGPIGIYLICYWSIKNKFIAK